MNILATIPAGLVTLLAAAASRTALLTGTAVDIQGYEGNLLVILESSAATAGTNPTLDVKIQDCDTSGGTFADVTGAAFAQVTTTAVALGIALDTGKVKRWIKVIGTLGGTATPTFVYGVCLVGLKKSY